MIIKTKVMKGIALLLILAVAGVFNFADSAFAINGTRMLGFSARDGAMAGATTASVGDTSCMIKNPASLVKIGNRVDFEYLNLLPHNVSMHTEGALANAGTRQKSKIHYLPGLDAGVSYQLPDLVENYPIAVGCGVFTMAGVAGSYTESRILPALTGQYDRFIYLTRV